MIILIIVVVVFLYWFLDKSRKHKEVNDEKYRAARIRQIRSMNKTEKS
jgi:uncharacterized membrane protein